MKWLFLLCVCILALQSCKKETAAPAITAPEEQEPLTPSDVPRNEAIAYRIDRNYFKHYVASADSIPIVSSNRVTYEALEKAKGIVDFMMQSPTKDLARWVRLLKLYIIIYEPDESPRDFPGWPMDNEPERYQFGFAPRQRFPACGANTGNLMNTYENAHYGQSVLMHEFAHGLKHFALDPADAAFERRIVKLWLAARDSGKWYNTYASTTEEEYWACGVQAYFNAYTEGPVIADGVYNSINTREELRDYDPDLYEAIREVWGDVEMPVQLWK